MPSNLETIDEKAFIGNNLEGEFVISDSIKNIGNYAFDDTTIDCEGITDEYFLKVCQSLEGVKNNITSLKFTDNSQIETIGDSAFKGNRLTTVTLPKSIKTI